MQSKLINSTAGLTEPPDLSDKMCENCGGQGYYPHQHGEGDIEQVQCQMCNGTGWWVSDCPQCNGTGLYLTDAQARYGDEPQPCSMCQEEAK